MGRVMTPRQPAILSLPLIWGLLINLTVSKPGGGSRLTPTPLECSPTGLPETQNTPRGPISLQSPHANAHGLPVKPAAGGRHIPEPLGRKTLLPGMHRQWSQHCSTAVAVLRVRKLVRVIAVWGLGW